MITADCTTYEPEGMFHALLCDPPYELGFMGRTWDSTGVAFNPETWAHFKKFLYPGAEAALRSEVQSVNFEVCQ